MQNPYGPGLLIPPEGLPDRILWHAKSALRVFTRRLLRPFDWLGLNRLRVMRVIWIKDRLDRPDREVSNFRLLHAARSVDLSRPGDEDFIRACKNYNSGVLNLGDVFVCEVSPAFYHPNLGLVANQSFEVFGDSVLLPHRFHLSPAYRSFRPRQVVRHSGPASSIQRIDAYNFWHWMADCLPQLLTLEKYMDGRPLALLASDNLGGFQRELLSHMLPATMTLELVPAKAWIKVDRFILPSYLSGRCNGYLPSGYYDEIRRRITHGLGLPESGRPALRIYLSRAGARRRRVGNESAVIEALRGYGFTTIRPESLSIREQVSLFQRAEVIVSPHGAALGAMVFAPHAKVLVLYAEKNPGEYFFTMARRLGIEHYALIHDVHTDEDSVDDFDVDQDRLEAMLEGPMGLGKQSVAA